MQQQQKMAGLVHHHQATTGTGLSAPRLRAAGGGMQVSFSSTAGAHGWHHNRVLVVRGRARHDKVVTAAARLKYCGQGRVVVATPDPAPESSRQMPDQHFGPSDDIAFSSSQQQLIIPTVRRNKDNLEAEMKVRDDELDEYGVVNNAIYASYLTIGRELALGAAGFGVDYWTSMGYAMALSELNLKYFAPLRRDDRFVVMGKPVQVKGVRLIIEHKIQTLPDRQLVLEGRATVVCLNKDFRPTRVFPELTALIKKVFPCEVA